MFPQLSFPEFFLFPDEKANSNTALTNVPSDSHFRLPVDHQGGHSAGDLMHHSAVVVVFLLLPLQRALPHHRPLVGGVHGRVDASSAYRHLGLLWTLALDVAVDHAGVDVCGGRIHGQLTLASIYCNNCQSNSSKMEVIFQQDLSILDW